MAKHKYLVQTQCVVRVPIYVYSDEELDLESLEDKASQQTGKELEDKVNSALKDINGKFLYLKGDWVLKKFNPCTECYVEI
jgi:hypothetical protein